MRMPTFCAMPMRELTLARCSTGTWSAIVAMNGARVALAPSCARNQPAERTATVVAPAMMTNAPIMTMQPPMSHGRRRPQREVVRSEKRPNTTLPTNAAMAPMLETMPRAEVFSASGTIWATLTAIAMTAGPRRATKKTNWARTSRVTKRGPTGFVGGANQWCSLLPSPATVVAVDVAPAGAIAGFLGAAGRPGPRGANESSA